MSAYLNKWHSEAAIESDKSVSAPHPRLPLLFLNYSVFEESTARPAATLRPTLMASPNIFPPFASNQAIKGQTGIEQKADSILSEAGLGAPNAVLGETGLKDGRVILCPLLLTLNLFIFYLTRMSRFFLSQPGQSPLRVMNGCRVEI